MDTPEQPSTSAHHAERTPRPGNKNIPLPADPRESARGRLKSLVMALIAIAIVAAFTWGVLSWREAQVQAEEAEQAAAELAASTEEMPEAEPVESASEMSV